MIVVYFDNIKFFNRTLLYKKGDFKTMKMILNKKNKDDAYGNVE
jgi:hypothetical protein